MKLNETLNLGKTDFPMRANLPSREPEWQRKWRKEKVYQRRQSLNTEKPSFSLHDGPPYANGNIHVGHALNKISKDIIIRSKSMSGFCAPYIPGWDTHGLPIEQVLSKKGIKRKEMDRGEYLGICRSYALSQVSKQMKDFKRLGISADWDSPYITLAPEYEAAQIRVFGKMVEKGYIYHGVKPVYWSWSSESALAEAEVEYHDLCSTAIYYANRVTDGKGLLDEDTYIVVWTTTPFTITASRGLAVGPDLDYAVVKPTNDNRKFLIAKMLIPQLVERFGWENPEVLKVYKGKELNQIVTLHPWEHGLTEVVISGDHVTLDSGTGIVHTAPGFGEDDYNIGIQYGLEVIVTVNEHGIMMDNAGPDFAGRFYDDVTPIVIEKLGDLLLSSEEISHPYPFDWRTNKPIIWRAVPQWFASVSTFRKNILDEIEKVKFQTEWEKNRLYNMIRERSDWVISRQRSWGVPLPIFYGEDGTPIISSEVIERVAKLFEEYGSIIWWEWEATSLLPDGFAHESSPNGEFIKETDIMDVWFDSGSSWNSVLQSGNHLTYPADVYLEGHDQYRGWFNSSLVTSVAVNGIAPYKQILSQGFVLDGKGEKMSKSKGNITLPSSVSEKFGADILRLWVASVDAKNDVRVSMDILTQVSEMYRKIRNTLRFLLANTSDFNVLEDTVDFEELCSVDKYMVILFNQLITKVRTAYDNFEIMTIYKAIVHFIVVDLSSFYLDIAKDVIYTDGRKSFNRRRFQTVFYHILVKITKLLTPILPHTSEEIWSYLNHEPEEFVQLSEFPEAESYPNDENILDIWSSFMDFRDQAHKALEKARCQKIIGKSLEAHLIVYPNEGIREVLASLDSDVAKLLIVSKFSLSNGPDMPKVATKIGRYSFIVERAKGEVCDRCRRISETVSGRPYGAVICEYCDRVLKENFPKAVMEGFEANHI